MKPSRVPLVTLIVVLVFFYLPIGFLVLNSFNNSRFASKWTGFSMRWYERLFERTDILMGMSLLLLFVTAGMSLSLVTITIAHVTFCLSYVALVVQARLQDFDFNVVEAARDLGATKLQAFLKVTLPLLAPGILAGGLLAFTLSIDDYVITYFVKGPGSDTLPTLVYSMIKKSKDLPVINALSSLMLIVTFAVVAISQRLTRTTA